MLPSPQRRPCVLPPASGVCRALLSAWARPSTLRTSSIPEYHRPNASGNVVVWAQSKSTGLDLPLMQLMVFDVIPLLISLFSLYQQIHTNIIPLSLPGTLSPVLMLLSSQKLPTCFCKKQWLMRSLTFPPLWVFQSRSLGSARTPPLQSHLDCGARPNLVRWLPRKEYERC